MATAELSRSVRQRNFDEDAYMGLLMVRALHYD